MQLVTRRLFVGRGLAAAGLVVAGATGATDVAAAALGSPSGIVPMGEIPVPDALPASWYIPDNQAAKDYRQQFNLSCEVVSYKLILLNYHMDGPEELLQALLGTNENPNKGFRGDYWALNTNGLQNYGAHAPALKNLVSIFPKPGLFNAVYLASMDQVRAALARNWLVMAWIPVALERSAAVGIKLSTGEWVSLVPGEHVIVLHGYDGSGFYTYDPRPSPRVPGYVKSDALERGMALFGHPALAIQPLF